MLNFDEHRFLRIQDGAVALAGPIDAAVQSCLQNGAENLFFVGTGGAGILMLPAARLLQTRSTFPTFVESPAELVAAGSVHLGPSSVVVIPSLSGATPESLEAMAYCQQRGATVLALTGHGDSPLAAGAGHTLVNFAEDDTSCESFYLQALFVALSVMRHRGEMERYDDILTELKALPSLLLEVKRGFESEAQQLAEIIAAGSFHVLTAAGSAWAQAWYYGMCILEEMQWIRTRPVHASDFFHGTLELVEEGVSVIVLKGEDECRPLAERVEAFVPRVGGALTVLDTADLPLPGISPDVRTLLSPVLLATVLERVSAHLEVLRDHPLTTRRYYKRVAY